MNQINRRNVLKGSVALAAFTPFASACSTTSVASGTDLANIDAVRTAELISSGEISAAEAVNAAIARTEQVNPSVNALASEAFDLARDMASNAPEGSLSGVPTAIKDLLDWEGQPTYYGSRAFKAYVAERQSPYMDDWLAAGTIPIGKTTTPEIGLISSTEPLVTGPTRNPWNTDYTPGGSSGGAAALVAARGVPVAHASDGGGSIRIPASCCGLFGLKPTIGRLSDVMDSSDGPVPISVNHAVTRSVRDSVALFKATEYTGDDATYEPMDMIDSPIARSLKIGLAMDPISNVSLDGDVRTAIEEVAALCESLGHEVIEVSPEIDGQAFTDAFLLYWAAGASEFAQSASQFANRAPSIDILEPWTLGLVEYFMARQDRFGAAVNTLISAGPTYEAMFDTFDVMLTPTLAQAPSKIGHQSPEVEFETLMDRVTQFAAYTPLQNVSGAPAMSVPLNWNASGLPIGSHFSARKGQDDLLFALAYQLEEARPWADKRPPVSA